VWGSYFNSDTRCILAILALTNTPYDFKSVDIFSSEFKNREDKYNMTINPSGQIPTIVEGSYKILAAQGSNCYINYLKNRHERLEKAFCPVDQRASITAHMNYF